MKLLVVVDSKLSFVCFTNFERKRQWLYRYILLKSSSMTISIVCLAPIAKFGWQCTQLSDFGNRNSAVTWGMMARPSNQIQMGVIPLGPTKTKILQPSTVSEIGC
jgi:hypothetical protein